MKSVESVRNSVRQQQILLVQHIWLTIWESSNTKGVMQWRDRNKLYRLHTLLNSNEYLLSNKDFQFLDSLHQKYKN